MKKEQFSNIGFIFTAIGSAIGLGNIWRFPYMLGANGGFAFLFAYIIALFLIGIPLMILELSVGSTYKTSFLNTYKKINPKLKYIALISLFISFIVTSYYLVINGWAFSYIFFSINKYPIFNIFSNSIISILGFLIITLLTILLVKKGIKKGIEKISKFLIPILFVLLISLAIYSLFLSGSKEAINYLFTPNWKLLLNIKTWILAFSQALFSLSVGTGILLTFGSFSKSKLSKPVFWIVFTDFLVAILSSIIVFSIVFTFKLTPNIGISLVFKTLPLLFQKLGFLGHILGISFFFLITIAAFTSSMSFVELLYINIKTFNPKKTKVYVFILNIMLLIIGSIFAFNPNFTSFADIWFGSIGLLFQPISLSLILGWLIPFKKLKHKIDNIYLKYFYYIAKFITPIILFILLLFIEKI